MPTHPIYLSIQYAHPSNMPTYPIYLPTQYTHLSNKPVIKKSSDTKYLLILFFLLDNKLSSKKRVKNWLLLKHLKYSKHAERIYVEVIWSEGKVSVEDVLS
jgi:hypothetical protein